MSKPEKGLPDGLSDLDDTDLRILDALQKDATLSTADLAEAVGLSQSPCWRRLARLKEAGFIRDQVARLDAAKLGFDALVFANVKLNAHGRANIAAFTEAVRRFPEVVECYAVMGAYDFMLRVVTRDIKAYEQFLFGKLTPLEGVQEVHSATALSEVKSTTALPIRNR